MYICIELYIIIVEHQKYLIALSWVYYRIFKENETE